ncbi:MAG: hypothetical protein RBT65_00655 [Methanolobus sp.]|nr:hypothetical protein [Methanolobus sp.]
MSVGKITSSQQDLAYVKTRPETGEILETKTGGTQTWDETTANYGQAFTAEHYFGRIKIAVKDAGGKPLIVTLWDSAAKNVKYHETIFPEVDQDQVLHWVFDPVPAGSYYWEIEVWRGNSTFRLYLFDGSTFGGAYEDGGTLPGKSFMSKICYCEDTEVERPVAVVGDTVDSGETTVKSGSPLGKIMVGTVEKNISREADGLNNGGRILNGAWFVEVDD